MATQHPGLVGPCGQHICLEMVPLLLSFWSIYMCLSLNFHVYLFDHSKYTLKCISKSLQNKLVSGYVHMVLGGERGWYIHHDQTVTGSGFTCYMTHHSKRWSFTVFHTCWFKAVQIKTKHTPKCDPRFLRGDSKIELYYRNTILFKQ